MPNITLSIPEEVYRKMKKYSEVKWSEVARKAIMEYLRKLEGTVSSEELKIIYPSTEDYRLAILLSKDLLKMGKPVPAVDITIAAVALNRNLVLETSDKHFKIIREINRELKLRLVDEYKCSCTDDFS